MFTDVSKAIVKNMVIATMQRIEVNSGVCRYNFRCQYNAVHDALNENHERIAMCFYLDGSYPVIHFVNYDNEGSYIDNTFGRWSEMRDYYLIKIIEKVDFFSVDEIFTAYRKELKRGLPFYIRWFSSVWY